MKSLKATDRQYKVGGSIDSWCGKCELVLAHTIEAMVGDKPARLHCNTCNSQHSYRPDAPAKLKAIKPRVSRHEKLLRETKTAARPYSASQRYAAGDVVQHAVFGIGIVRAVKDATKVEVLFESGPKLLVHDRS